VLVALFDVATGILVFSLVMLITGEAASLTVLGYKC
jgi:hypothetical protein